MGKVTLLGDIVLEWLEKWPDLPNNQLARMIYNSDNNHLLFTSKESVRSAIRYYKGQNGDSNRKQLATTKFIKNE